MDETDETGEPELLKSGGRKLPGPKAQGSWWQFCARSWKNELLICRAIHVRFVFLQLWMLVNFTINIYMSVPYDASNFGARPNNDGEATAKVASPSGEMVKNAQLLAGLLQSILKSAYIFFTNVNSTISLCWNISKTLQFFKTQFSQTNLYKFSETTNQQTIFGDIWVAPPFFWGGETKNIPKNSSEKKTSSNSEVSERRIPRGITTGRRCLARRTRWHGGRAKVLSKSYHHWRCFCLFCRKAWDLFEWFFFECWDFLQAFKTESNVECRTAVKVGKSMEKLWKKTESREVFPPFRCAWRTTLSITT